MPTFALSILSPRGKAFEGPVESIIATGREGELGILAHHAPIIAALRPGIARVRTGDKQLFFVLGGGVLEVSQKEVNVLANTAEQAANLDEAHDLLKKLQETLTAPAPVK